MSASPKSKSPLITVVTINFNDCEGLKSTMASVLCQEGADFEYIVIDGGSTDGSREVIEENRERLAFSCSESDNGVYNAMNKGVAHASGAYLLFLNSGDRLVSGDVLAKVSRHLGAADIVYGDLELYYPESGVIKHYGYPDKVTIQYLRTCSLPHPASFIRTSLLRDTPYREDYKIVSDWVFFCQKIVYDNCTTLHLPMVVSVFAMDGLSNSQACATERAAAGEKLFPAMVSEIADKVHLFESKGLMDVYLELAHTRKLCKRLMPMIKLALKVDKALKRRKH